jgi:hypothetical protein
MYRQDIAIKAAVQTKTNSIVSTIGMPTHEDTEIAEFLEYNVKKLEDVNGKSWASCLSTIQNTTFWAGASVSEPLYDIKFGSLTLKDIVTYHPNTINIYLDKKGMLSENLPSMDGFHKSGIYQFGLLPNSAEQLLDSWKIIYLPHESDFGNYYGNSLIAPCYKWFRLKEAVVDMMATSLDRLGQRMAYVSMTSTPTSEMRYDPSTGEEKAITNLRLVEEQINAMDGGMPSLLLLANNVAAGTDAKAGSVQLSDPIGNAFLNAIGFIEEQCTKHIIPYFLISDSTYGESSPTAGASERRMEVYYDSLDFHRNQLISVLTKKIFNTLITWNFSRESAKQPAMFTKVYSDRPEDRVSTMQMIKGLTEVAVLNPRNSVDFSMMRQMVRCADRKQTPDDLKFVKEMLIEPKSKARLSDIKKAGAGAKGRPTGDSMPNQTKRE